MKKSILSAILLIACVILPSSMWAGTFKVTNVCNGSSYDNICSGSTVESLGGSFSISFDKAAHMAAGVNSSQVKIVNKESGASYTAEAIYPNLDYSSTEGMLRFGFWNGMLKDEGTWELTIPAGTFCTDDGDVNEEFVGTWTIQKPYDEPFNITVTNNGAASGSKVNRLNMYFHVVADNPIVKCDGSCIQVYKGNTALGYISNYIYNEDGSCDIVFGTWYENTVDGKDVGGITSSGVYTLDFRAGAFRDANNYTSEPYSASWTVSSSATATLSIDAAAQWGTFVVPFRISRIPEGVTAYEVTGVTPEGNIKLSRVDMISANTPCVVHAENGFEAKEFKGSYVYGTPTSTYLQGVYADTYAPVGSYVLQNQDAVNFYHVTSANTNLVKANHCYLTLPAEVSSVKGFIIDGTTAIENISVTSNNNSVFDLSGRRVDKPSKGLYIVNGKKVMY